jgi:hypothetical protein
MPYTQNHWLITVGGDAWLQSETWQFGVRATMEGVITPADQQLLANALAVPTQTFYTDGALNICAQARLLWVKAAMLDEEGHYLFETGPGLYTYPTPVAGTGTPLPVPQATIAVTTLTAIARGRASKGRFYLPPATQTVQTDGRITITNADNIEGAARTWLNAINATAQVSNVSVMSKLGTGTTNPITAVGVGRVIDTMRSRRRSLAEARTPLAL